MTIMMGCLNIAQKIHKNDEYIKDEKAYHGLDKMKAEEITSEKAWADFKAGYSDFEEKHIDKSRDGDDASIADKLDILSAKISELNTDMSRLTDSVPQALGITEEGKTLEDEQESESEDDAGIFDDDDGLEEYFSEGAESEDEESDDEVAESDDDGGEDVGESEEEDEDTDPVEAGESDDEDEQESEEGALENEESDDEDEYISFDEMMNSEDDESDDVESEDEESDDEYDEMIDKMISVLEQMDGRIKKLEIENRALKQSISKMTVQARPDSDNLVKSRPNPVSNVKLIKGSYNRPPVSTQYGQWDAGAIAKHDVKNSVMGRELNEVFADCERIARGNKY